MDLAAALVLAVIAVPLVALANGPVRIIPLLLMVFLVPGFCLLAILYPRAQDLDWPERLALSFGMSLCLVPLLALVLAYSPWGMHPLPLASSVAMLTGVLAVAALRRRQALAVYGVSGMNMRPQLPDAGLRRALSPRNVWRSFTLVAVAALLLVGSVIYVIVIPKTVDTFTQFSLLGPGGQFGSYPRTAVAGHDVPLILDISNQEGKSVVYYVTVVENGSVAQKIGPLRLASEGSRQVAVAVQFAHPGAHQQVQFLLYLEGYSTPYRALNLQIDVASSS